jgi:hypothetical protein
MIYFDKYKNVETNLITMEGFKKFLVEVQETPQCFLEEEAKSMLSLHPSLCSEVVFCQILMFFSVEGFCFFSNFRME